MKNWSFQKGSLENGELVFKPINVQLEYIKALNTALDSNVSSPIFSGFHVKGGLVYKDHIIRAGNIEYGLCNGIHCEEAAIAALFSILNDKPSQKATLALIAGRSGEIIPPCGNCRDLLFETFSRNLDIICACPDDNLATVIHFNEFLIDKFEEITLKSLSKREITSAKNCLLKGRRITNDLYSPPTFSDRKYYVSLQTNQASYYGSHDLCADYHPIYGLEDAIRQARRANDPFIESIFIVNENSPHDSPPHVMYKDRQWLIEVLDEAQIRNGKKINPPVYLLTSHDNEFTRLWRTSARQWLPLAFSSYQFGDNFINASQKYYALKPQSIQLDSTPSQ